MFSLGLTVPVCLLQQSADELIKMAHKYYDEVALPKLVTFLFKKKKKAGNFLFVASFSLSHKVTMVFSKVYD